MSIVQHYGTLPETSLHLLFCCNFSILVWQDLYTWLGHAHNIDVDCLRHFSSHLWLVSDIRSLRSQWIALWLVVCLIWLHRNEMVFKKQPLDLGRVMKFTRIRSWSRLTHNGYKFILYVQWLEILQNVSKDIVT